MDRGKLLKDYGGSIPSMVKALGGFAWDPEDAELTREALDKAHLLGLKVVVWSWPEKLGTAFDAQLVAKMIDWGVDGIITDDPGRLISMLAASDGIGQRERKKPGCGTTTSNLGYNRVQADPASAVNRKASSPGRISSKNSRGEDNSTISAWGMASRSLMV